jgi:hypothetical protein
VSAIGAFEPNLHRYVQDNGAQTIDRIIDTGELDDQAAEELSNLITAAVDLYLKENPEAALA